MHPVVEITILLLRIIYFYIEAFVKLFLPANKKEIKGQNVLITGGGRGIGRAMAIKFSQQGANIALWDIHQQGLDETADDLKIRGVTVYTYLCDVTDRESVKKAASDTKKDMGEINILVNNAGVLNCKPIMELTEADIRKCYEVNTISHFWTVQEFLPAMMARKSGHIVTTASMAAKGGSPLLTDYCASKWAAYGFTEALRMELRAQDPLSQIYTTTICPMFVNTNLIYNDDINQRIKIRMRFGEFLDADAVAVATVEGVLTNTRHVYVPAFAGGFDIGQVLLPHKAQLALYDFMDTSFIPVKK